jgi:hypothetical protein
MKMEKDLWVGSEVWNITEEGANCREKQEVGVLESDDLPMNVLSHWNRSSNL